MNRSFIIFLMLLFFANCKQKIDYQNKVNPVLKNLIFLDYFENMSRNEFDSVSEKLIKLGKIKKSKGENGITDYYYNAGNCTVKMFFLFNDGSLRSVTLMDAECLLDIYKKKYPSVQLNTEKYNLIDNIGYNKDYDSNSLYTVNGETIYCDWPKETLSLSGFEAKIKKTGRIAEIKKLKNNPTFIKKQKVAITITEKSTKNFGVEIFSRSLPPHESISMLRKGLPVKSYSIVEKNPLGNPETAFDFYSRTRSQYIAIERSEILDPPYTNSITYQTIWDFKASVNRNESIKKLSSELENKKPEAKKDVVDDI